MATSAENWEQVKELFAAALELRPEERHAYLHQNASEESICKEVERLLAEHEEAGSFLSNPIDSDALLRQTNLAGQFNGGELLDGKFKILRLIAEGGMGQVWLAEQTVPLRRQVVVKLIKVGVYDHNSLERFRAERQSLAIMEHPCIAKVFDAGATPAGQPYFVMEYVPGLPITKYCDEKKLSIPNRLELFIKVCEGVQHAHLKALIHRDLKPANILVVEVDGKSTPRIIDFGIAKATSPLARAEFTQTGGFVGTPGYMSPEQTDPRVGDVDTRTDVYSLGAILYVLLAGSLPFDPKEWQQQPLDEMLRHLREDDPPRPSTKVSTTRETVTATAEARATDIKRLVGLLRGDLDWITMKALEKDRTRRYGTPSELATDIRLHLDNEPVLARPASSGYRLRKYMQRHRIAVAAAAGITLLLIGFGVMQTVQLHRTTRERDRANRERDRASRITDFMIGMFKVSNPNEARGNTITAREILDKASNEIDAGLAKDPETQTQMMFTMGSVYGSLGLYDRAQKLDERVVDIRFRALGPQSPDTLKAMRGLAWILFNKGQYACAETLQLHTLDLQRLIVGPEHPDTLASMNNLAAIFDGEGRRIEAEKLNRDTLEIRRRVLGPEHPDTLTSMSNLAAVLMELGHNVEAEKLFRETLEIRRRVLWPEHPDTLVSMSNLSVVLGNEGRYAEMEKLDRDALEIRRRLLGPQHPETLASMNNLAVVLSYEERYAEAEKLDREALDVRLRVLGAEHPDTLESRSNLGLVLASQGRYVEAEKLYREVADVRREVFGPEHPNTLTDMSNLIYVLIEEGHYVEADKLARDTLDISRRVLGTENSTTAILTYNLGVLAVHQGRLNDAFSQLTEAVDHGLSVPNDLDLENDTDLKPLHGDPRFKTLVAHAKERAAAAGGPK
jgi:serine/threonine protein kinase